MLSSLKYLKILAITISLTSIINLIGCSVSAGGEFDERNIQKIEKGITKQNQILNLFGEPYHQAVDSNGMAQWTYMYATRNVVASEFGSTSQPTKTLQIIFDKSGVVQNYTFQSFGK